MGSVRGRIGQVQVDLDPKGGWAVRAVLVRVRSELRASWRAWLALAILIGISGGVAIGAAAGARRTATAYDRYRSEFLAHDAAISNTGTRLRDYAAKINALPEVESGGLAATVYFNFLDPQPPAGSTVGQGFVSVGDGYGSRVDRPRLLAGRRPTADAPAEVLVNRFFANRLGVSVDDAIRARQSDLDPNTPDGPTLNLRVVGIAVYPNEIVPLSTFDRFPAVYLSPAFYRDVVDKQQVAYYVDFLRLQPGIDTRSFVDAARRIARAHGETSSIFFTSDQERIARVRRALAPLGIALGVFAAVVGVTLLLVFGQLLARQLTMDASVYPRLRALGMTQRELVAVGVTKAAIVAAVGAALAMAGAVAISPLTLIGPARLAEPNPGTDANPVFLVVGFAAIALVFPLMSLIPSRRAAGRAAGSHGLAEIPGAERPSALTSAVARIGLPVSGVAGVRMALEPGRGPSAVPVHSTLVAAVLALTTIGATLTFGASLNRMISVPEAYGQRWDQLYDAAFSGLKVADLTENPDIEALSGGFYNSVSIDGRRISAVGVDVLRGDAMPTVVEGRAPTSIDEIALGALTLRILGRSIGDTVSVELDGSNAHRMLVVGRAVLPRFGQSLMTPTGLGDGALLVAQAMASGAFPGTRKESYGFVLVRYRQGLTSRPTEASLRRRCDEVNESGELCLIETEQIPADIETYAQVRALPTVLTGLLGAIGAAAIGHALVSAARRRRRDLAILKTIGFVRGQVRATVAWQASTVATIALLFGLPAGVAAGGWAWRAFSDEIGAVPTRVVPQLLLALMVPAVLVVANLVAALPARAAARLRPAFSLRAE